MGEKHIYITRSLDSEYHKRKIDKESKPFPMDIRWYDDKVVIGTAQYENIFGMKRKECGKRRKLSSLVKITYKGKSITREYLGMNLAEKSEDGTPLFLTYPSLRLLNIDSNESAQVTVSKGCWFPFYWNHLNSATRISFRLGFIGIGLTIYFGVVSLCISCCCCLACSFLSVTSIVLLVGIIIMFLL